MNGISQYITRFNLLRQIPVFSKLNWFQLRRLARKSVVVEYCKGEVIRREGDPPDYFYCLVSGRLQAYSFNEDGIKQNVEFIHRGMHFGIISTLTGENHSLNYEAINDSVVLQVSRDDFHEILKVIPSLGITFSQSLSRRIRTKVKGDKPFFESTIISIYSPVKGTGSSTYAINLAVSLAKETKKKIILVNIQTRQNGGFKVVAVDQNSTPQWNATAFELKDILSDQGAVFSYITKDESKVDLLNVAFDASQVYLKKQISPLVSTLVGDYHYVIVDLPNEMDDFVRETLTQSDAVHLVTFDRAEDLDLTRKVIDSLELTFKEKFQEEKISIIVRPVDGPKEFSYDQLRRAVDFEIYTILPPIKPAEFITVQTSHCAVLRCVEESEYAKVVTRIARQIGGVMVGLVLGEGAALGVAHIGVIRVLEQENIPIDVIVGSSMGALVGSLWATGRNAGEIQKIASEFQEKRSLLTLFDPVIPVSGLIAGRAIKRWLAKHLGEGTFYTTRIPLKVVSYDLIRREEIVIDHGSLVDAVRQSISIPGVIEPVINKEQVIIDGGVLNPLPTNVLAEHGIRKIIAVNVLQSPDDAVASFEIAQQRMKEREKISFARAPWFFIRLRLGRFLMKGLAPNISDIIVRTLQASEYVIAQQSALKANVVIHPNLVGINWFELYKVDELIQRGEEAARAALPKIKKLIEGEGRL